MLFIMLGVAILINCKIKNIHIELHYDEKNCKHFCPF
jgi:hypothetical protein